MSDFVIPADAIGSPLIQVDNDLNIININQQAENFFAKKYHELIGKNYIALCQEAKIDLPTDLLDNIQNQIALQFETEITPHNQVKTFCWNVISLNNKQNYILLANDISDYKTLQQKEEGLQAYLEHILDNIPCYIYWKDINSVYMGCNKKFAQAAGLSSPEEVIGKTDYDFVWGKTEAHLFRQGDLEVLRGIPKLDFEEPQLQADGKHAVVLASKVPMRNKTGKIIGILGIYLDITDRKRAEEELKEAKERAEIANHAKSEFLAVVSHELRLPLTAILGMAQLLSGENLLPEHQSQVNDIIKSGEHLHALVNDILDFARLEAGKVELHPAPLDLKKIVEEVATMLANQAKNKNLELLIDYTEDVPHRVIGDARALRQILLNLCGNALKFTERGHIVIKVTCKEKTATHATLMLNVKDTGIGIPPEKLDIIFDRFSQVDSSRSRRYSGVGLGLTITKQYVMAMGGDISVKSTLGEGTAFTCKLPFELQNTAAYLSPWHTYKSNVRILIVDDTLRGKVLQKQIASSLCQVVTGHESLNTIRAAYQAKQPYDIVIIDQRLENIDAIEFAKTIRQQRLQQPMMLLAIPGYSLPIENAARAAGFFGCIVKPTQPTEFLIDLTAFWEKWLEQKHETKQASLMISAAAKPRVLLVEDDEIVQRVHFIMLERAGCKVDIAKNGKQALNSFIEHPYDLVFMDIGLPDITGFEVAAAIRQHEHNQQRTPIIGLTGYSDEEDRQNCLIAGMDAVAIKPVKPEELRALLHQWVSKKFSS